MSGAAAPRKPVRGAHAPLCGQSPPPCVLATAQIVSPPRRCPSPHAYARDAVLRASFRITGLVRAAPLVARCVPVYTVWLVWGGAAKSVAGQPRSAGFGGQSVSLGGAGTPRGAWYVYVCPYDLCGPSSGTPATFCACCWVAGRGVGGPCGSLLHLVSVVQRGVVSCLWTLLVHHSWVKWYVPVRNPATRGRQGDATAVDVDRRKDVGRGKPCPWLPGKSLEPD